MLLNKDFKKERQTLASSKVHNSGQNVGMNNRCQVFKGDLTCNDQLVQLWPSRFPSGRHEEYVSRGKRGKERGEGRGGVRGK